MNVNVINHMTQEYLQYENYKCKKEVVDELVEECNENIDENEMIYNVTLNDYRNVQILYNIIVLFAIALLVIIGISNAFIYF